MINEPRRLPVEENVLIVIACFFFLLLAHAPYWKSKQNQVHSDMLLMVRIRAAAAALCVALYWSNPSFYINPG